MCNEDAKSAYDNKDTTKLAHNFKKLVKMTRKTDRQDDANIKKPIFSINVFDV